jgi:3-hydroxybutyryl-CoA dehydrogenase
VRLEDVKKVAVIGAGTMGPGLAQVFATAGYEVALYSRTEETLQKAQSVMASNLQTFVEQRLLEQHDVPQILARIYPTRSLEEAGEGADVLVETSAEDREVKRSLYERLDGICPARTVFTSNTSYLNIYELMPERRLPQTVIAHWFAPPHIIPLVEVVKGERTAPETAEFVCDLLKKVDRVPSVMEKFVPGFCVNRILRIIGREVFFLLDNGYMTPEQLDIAVKASIIPRAMVLGFVQRYDFTGLDLSYANLQNPTFIEAPVDNQPRSLKERVERGELGVKSGRGFFDYDDRPLEEVLRERDVALIRVFEQVKDLIYRRI